MQDDADMSIEPSAVPPYWSFSTTRSQLLDERPSLPAGESDSTGAGGASEVMMGFPPSSSSNPGPSAWNPGAPSSGIDEDSVLHTVASLLSGRNTHPAPYVHLPPRNENGDQLVDSHHRQHQEVRNSELEGDGNNEDDDDPSKGPASGPNALPVSPPRRIRRLPNVHHLLDSDSSSEESCGAGCPAARCTCSRLSSPFPQSQAPSSSSSLAPAPSPTSSTSKGKRKRDYSYIRKCSYLQPGTVFTGSQSFTTFANAYANTSYPTSATRDHHRRSWHPYAPLHREPDPLYNATSGLPSRRFLDSALDHLQTLGRHAASGIDRPPFSSSAPLPPRAPFQAAPDSAWSAIEGSAIDPEMQDLLAGNPSYGYTSGNSISRASATEEWEVQVSISSIDYVHGKVTGIMTALNVPNSSCLPPTPSSIGPSSTSLAKGSDSPTSVTTSFEGEIIDLHNNSLWTRSAPSSSSGDSSSSGAMHEDEDEDDEMRSFASGSASSRTGGPWLASNHTVDKTTDLEYWAKLDAFASYGPLAEKEICKIAREGKWPERSQHGHVRRPNPQDYVLMRWKGESIRASLAVQLSCFPLSLYRARINSLTSPLLPFSPAVHLRSQNETSSTVMLEALVSPYLAFIIYASIEKVGLCLATTLIRFRRRIRSWSLRWPGQGVSQRPTLHHRLTISKEASGSVATV